MCMMASVLVIVNFFAADWVLLLPPTLKKATPRLMLFPRVTTLLLQFLISFFSPPAPIQTTDVILPALGGGRSKGQLIQLALCTSATLKYSSEYYSTIVLPPRQRPQRAVSSVKTVGFRTLTRERSFSNTIERKWRNGDLVDMVERLRQWTLRI